MTFRISHLVLATSLSFMAASPALADAITLSPSDIGRVVDVAYNGFDGSGVIAGLTGTTRLTLTGVTGTSYTFGYAVDNTSTAPITTSRISGFGFNTNPNIAGATSTGAYNIVGTNANVPNVGSVDVCFKDGGGTNSCAGGGGGGVTLGDSGTGSLTLNFASALTSLSLSDFFVRYQSITGTGAHTPSSASGLGTISSSSGGSSSGGTPVPEPGMLLLFGGAVGGMAWLRRQRAGSARQSLSVA